MGERNVRKKAMGRQVIAQQPVTIWRAYSQCLELFQPALGPWRYLLPSFSESGHCSVHQTNGNGQEGVEIVKALAAAVGERGAVTCISTSCQPHVSCCYVNVLASNLDKLLDQGHSLHQVHLTHDLSHHPILDLE